MSADPAGTDARLPHVHFESLTDRPVFHIGSKRLETALACHPALRARVSVSRGEDLAHADEALRRAEVLITSEFVLAHPRFPLRRLPEAAPHLRWIHVTNAGIEKLLPLDWLPEGLVLTNSSGAHFDKAREFAAMAILMLHTGLPRMLHNQWHRRWEKLLTPTAGGRTLCVVGVGQLGSAFVAEGVRLGMRVIGVRRTPRPEPGVEHMYAPAELGQALAEADIVAVCTPLTPDTEGLVDRRAFACMRPGVGFINVGRARVVDYAALQDGLRSGHVGGAILDVFYPEPLPADSDLWDTPNLLMTPHVAMDDTDHFLARCLQIGLENLGHYLDGRPLRNVVDAVRGY